MLVFSNYLTEGFLDNLKTFGNTIKTVAPLGMTFIGGTAATLAGFAPSIAAHMGMPLGMSGMETVNNIRNYGSMAAQAGMLAMIPQRVNSLKNMTQQTYQKERIKQQMRQQNLQQQVPILQPR